jgi:hypothetical protein
MPAGRLCGEITPEYSLLPDAGVAHVYRLNPQIKLILCFRDPIDRAWSHIRMSLKHRSDLGNAVERIAKAPGVLERGNYPDVLQRWTAQFPKESLLIEFTDNIGTRPLAVLERVCGFLGVEYEERFFGNADNPVHTGSELELPEALYRDLRAYYEPVCRQMAEQFPEPCLGWLRRHYS